MRWKADGTHAVLNAFLWNITLLVIVLAVVANGEKPPGKGGGGGGGHEPFDMSFCGNGVVEPGEDCDGSVHCDNATCRCLTHYAPTAARPVPSGGCMPVCGDGFVAPEEECDSTAFCHSVTCRCLLGHALNPLTHLCSGCGNGVLDAGEECDGGTGCSSICTCEPSFVPTDPPSTFCVFRLFLPIPLPFRHCCCCCIFTTRNEANRTSMRQRRFGGRRRVRRQRTLRHLVVPLRCRL